MDRRCHAASKLQQAARSWLQVTEVEDRRAVEIILADLGSGEAEVIQMARERATTQVVLDDLDARRYARRVGLEPVGTLGLLLAARLRGEIHSLGAEIVRLRQVGFYITDALIEAVLKAADEG